MTKNQTKQSDIPTIYDHQSTQERMYQRWLDSGVFSAVPDDREDRYVIMMPLPNVTGALHMGHAMDNVMQDLLIRWHRMMGNNTLWMPGSDHAGIATQAVVEKRLYELEGKTRHDIGQEGLVARIWKWKDQYQQRIMTQQQQMGCSCDWDRQRFTMDEVCSSAVRETFFRMFRDGLIYRGNRLVNWDCQLQTAISDDEIVYETVQGYFWHLRYPVVNPKPGEPEYVEVATTRPETMLGDTGVACHPQPEKSLDRRIEKLKERYKNAPGKERPAILAEIERIEARKKTHLPVLEQLVQMAEQGRMVMLPLQNREIPLITDEWAKPEMGSGCVKITPGHDPNDYEVWQRNQDRIEAVNILNPDGHLNENGGVYAGLDRFAARDKVVADLQEKGLLSDKVKHEVEIGHSDRSKTPIEPYLSKQWFVKMDDIQGGITCGRGTKNEFRAAGLAQAAIDAVRGNWQSPTGRKLTFHPDAERYGATYCNWLSEKRDWCISRQLWWGHRIPIRSVTADAEKLTELVEQLGEINHKEICVIAVDQEGDPVNLEIIQKSDFLNNKALFELWVCPRNKEVDEKYNAKWKKMGLIQDPDVLDTWFSSALWPQSTLGWPDPDKAKIHEGQTPLAGSDDKPSPLSYYYPGSCLVTARDIITLWVARMTLAGLYNLGDIPFTDCFIHANILDGKGERMSKSKGNGIDPINIIDRYGADAMRYVLCDMQTGTQDIRLPVQAISPYTEELVDLATAKHGQSIFTYICPKSGKEFDVLGAMKNIPSAKVISDRFDVGKNFCNKLWNAARFSLLNLDERQDFRPLTPAELEPEDRWVLSRLNHAITEVTKQLEAYNPSAAVGAARNFFWSEFCDWYLELIKPRIKDQDQSFVARQVLGAVMDQALRLFHPFLPFITELIWELLHDRMPIRGIGRPFAFSDRDRLLISSEWPLSNPDWQDQDLERNFDMMRETIRSIRNVRSKYQTPPSKKLVVWIKASGATAERLDRLRRHIVNQSGLSEMRIGSDMVRPELSTVQVVSDFEIYIQGALDPVKEKARLINQMERLKKQKAGCEKKLSNENFINRAPAKVVETEKNKLKDIFAQLSAIDKNFKIFD
ncbi:MAG: hypothetical protein B6244_08260 [Candidatus Cloacimonetes bacterium 4572_55]|nr:MAG: hypothetical protein B6244_08260 [Candidatus Cloacimonetes bacterium 4572_55]